MWHAAGVEGRHLDRMPFLQDAFRSRPRSRTASNPAACWRTSKHPISRHVFPFRKGNKRVNRATVWKNCRAHTQEKPAAMQLASHCYCPTRTSTLANRGRIPCPASICHITASSLVNKNQHCDACARYAR